MDVVSRLVTADAVEIVSVCLIVFDLSRLAAAKLLLARTQVAELLFLTTISTHLLLHLFQSLQLSKAESLLKLMGQTTLLQ